MADDNRRMPRQPSYEIGYGKPPRGTRFKPGKSGNPKGRPKKQKKSLGLTINDVLSERTAVRINGELRYLTNKELIIESLVERTLNGDKRAFSALFKFREQVDARGDLSPLIISTSEDGAKAL